MKPIGVVGGIGPESTIDYYRAMIAAYQEQRPDGSYPAIVITSVDAGAFLGPLMGGDHDTVLRVLVAELERLARAGAGCAIIAANSPHVVFAELQRRSPLPLVSIVEATALEAVRLACRRLALFGTRVTMQGRFYQEVFEPRGLALVVPCRQRNSPIDEIERAMIAGEFVPYYQPIVDINAGKLLGAEDAAKAAANHENLLLFHKNRPLPLWHLRAYLRR